MVRQAKNQTDIRQGQIGRQAGNSPSWTSALWWDREAGGPLDFSTNLDAINSVCLVPSGGSVLTITFRENNGMFSSEILSLKGGRAFVPTLLLIKEFLF